MHRLSLHAGSRVIEAGTGSGGLTTALAWAVMPTGMVFTHEVRPDIYQVARRESVAAGVAALRQDVRHRHRGWLQSRRRRRRLSRRARAMALPAFARKALRPGGFFASLLPTANQVIELLNGFDRHHFADVSVEELILRRYKATPDRFRPDDNLIGHTGYLIFARCIDVARGIWRAGSGPNASATRRGCAPRPRSRRRRRSAPTISPPGARSIRRCRCPIELRRSWCFRLVAILDAEAQRRRDSRRKRRVISSN